MHLHVVEVEGSGLNLPGVGLGGVLHVEDGALPELSVVVKAQLRVRSVDLKKKLFVMKMENLNAVP